MHKDSYTVLPLMREGLYLLYNYYLWSDFGLKKTQILVKIAHFSCLEISFSRWPKSRRDRDKKLYQSRRDFETHWKVYTQPELNLTFYHEPNF